MRVTLLIQNNKILLKHAVEIRHLAAAGMFPVKSRRAVNKIRYLNKLLIRPQAWNKSPGTYTVIFVFPWIQTPVQKSACGSLSIDLPKTRPVSGRTLFPAAAGR